MPTGKLSRGWARQATVSPTNRQGRDPYQYILDPASKTKQKASLLFIQIQISILWASPLQMIAALHFQPEDKMPGTNDFKKPKIFTDLLK